MGEKPLAFIDVDGVLNIIDFWSPLKEGMTLHQWKLRNGRTYKIRLRREFHSRLLLELESAGFELAWGTTWEEDANKLIRPQLNLPRWPVAAVEKVYREGPYSEYTSPVKFSQTPKWNWKAPGILALAGDRPFVWIDDDFAPADHGWARRRSRKIPTLLIKTSPAEGLMLRHVLKAKRWLADNELS